jgi:hypothetical protein
MAVAFGFPQPSVQGYNSPVALNEVYRDLQVDPADFYFKDIIPIKEYPTKMFAFDVIAPVTGTLRVGSEDGHHTPSQARNRRRVIATGVFRYDMRKLRPSDITNQAAPGTLGELDPGLTESLLVQELSIETQYTLERDRVQAMLGSLTLPLPDDPVNTVTFTYPDVFTATSASTSASNYQIPVSWDHKNSDGLYDADILSDIMGQAMLMRGFATNSTFFYNYAIGRLISHNINIINAMGRSEYANLLGPSNGPGGVAIRGGQISTVLQWLTGIKACVQYDVGWNFNNGDGTFTYEPFLPDTRTLMVGNVNNQPIGVYAVGPTVENAGMMAPSSGLFLRVIDQFQGHVEVCRLYKAGFFGLPLLFFQKALCAGTPVF